MPEQVQQTQTTDGDVGHAAPLLEKSELCAVGGALAFRTPKRIEGPAISSVLFLLAGPFEPLVGKIWPESCIGEYLSANDARRHVWHGWLAKCGAKIQGASAGVHEARRASFNSETQPRPHAGSFSSWPHHENSAKALAKAGTLAIIRPLPAAWAAAPDCRLRRTR